MSHRAGKTSIKRVIFNKMSPHETLWLTSTSEVSVKGRSVSGDSDYRPPHLPPPIPVAEVSNSAFVQFEMLDFPGKLGQQIDQAASVPMETLDSAIA